MAYPAGLQAVLDTFALFPDMADRANLLLSYADTFREVPPAIASRPFPNDHLVPHCESEAYVWAVPQPGGTGTSCCADAGCAPASEIPAVIASAAAS